MDALREIVINMIVHRDYMHYGDPSVKIYDDYIEFFNPGRLPENITVEQLLSGDYSSQARNKKIASLKVTATLRLRVYVKNEKVRYEIREAN